MAEQVSLEDVGNAEAVLSRLVQERKSLENAGKVLQTYRKVKTELQPALDKLSEVEGKVEEVQQRLSNMQAQEKVALDKVEKNIAAYERKRGEQVEENIRKLEATKAKLEGENEKMRGEMKEEVERYEKDIREASVELERINTLLEKAKSEHGVLAEAVVRAAQMFI